MHRAKLIVEEDLLSKCVLWTARCECGWASATEHDAHVVVQLAADHDGGPASLLQREIDRAAPGPPAGQR